MPTQIRCRVIGVICPRGNKSNGQFIKRQQCPFSSFSSHACLSHPPPHPRPITRTHNIPPGLTSLRRFFSFHVFSLLFFHPTHKATARFFFARPTRIVSFCPKYRTTSSWIETPNRSHDTALQIPPIKTIKSKIFHRW